MTKSLPISIAIPTYRRESVLVDTLNYLLSLPHSASEILVLDQTELHEFATEQKLKVYHDTGKIRWIQLSEPSIPQAMNRGLLEARNDIVLFVDDDIRPERELVSAHLTVHKNHDVILVAGRVIQPWEEGKDLSKVGSSSFAGTNACWTGKFIGCNFSVSRNTALEHGGFDANFVRVAYHFEAEFAHRWIAAGHRIYFEPTACLHHLKDVSGGTRTFGEHLTTWKPDHAVGAYYYCLRTGKLLEILKRPLRAIVTRHHLQRPWWIPITVISETLGAIWATFLYIKGPNYTRIHHKISSTEQNAKSESK